MPQLDQGTFLIQSFFLCLCLLCTYIFFSYFILGDTVLSLWIREEYFRFISLEERSFIFLFNLYNKRFLILLNKTVSFLVKCFYILSYKLYSFNNYFLFDFESKYIYDIFSIYNKRIFLMKFISYSNNYSYIKRLFFSS